MAAMQEKLRFAKFRRLIEAGFSDRKPTGQGKQARADIFDGIALFYAPKRKHANNAMLSPVAFETRQPKRSETSA